MSIFTSNTIKKRVMAHVMRKIEEGERAYTAGAKGIDEKAEKDIEDIKKAAEQHKVELADSIVEDILK